MTDPNWKNRTLFRGDDLGFLRAMNSESVDLIATDPPFNKNKDFHATPDSLAKGAKFQDRWSWERDVQQEWVDQISDDYPRLMEAIESARYAHSDGMGAFMCFMAVRLLEMRRVLKDTGSIYLHCDDAASHYLKAVMDAIFGWRNFRNEIIWERSAGRSDAKSYARVHDGILYYGKTTQAVWHQQYDPLTQDYIDQNYRYKDEQGRYTTMPLKGGGVSGKTHAFTWRGVSAGNWRFTVDSLEKLEAAGLIHWSRKGQPRRKFYLSESKGIAARDLITNINRAPKSERTGYPTQKPLALYERLIRASTNPGDMVLDPFAGCATTCVAAERLGRQWVGIDIWAKAHRVVIKRLETEGALQEPGGGQNALCSETSTMPPIRLDARTMEGSPRRFCASRCGTSGHLWSRGRSCRGLKSSRNCPRRRASKMVLCCVRGAAASSKRRSWNWITSSREQMMVTMTSQTASCYAAPAMGARAPT